MKHRLFLDKDGIIENVYDGEVGFGEMQKILTQLYGMVFRLEDKGQRVLILVDLTKIGKVKFSEIKTLATMGIKSFKFEKMAVFGSRKEIEVLARLVLGLAGKSKLLEIFKTEKEAREWLVARKARISVGA